MKQIVETIIAVIALIALAAAFFVGILRSGVVQAYHEGYLAGRAAVCQDHKEPK